MLSLLKTCRLIRSEAYGIFYNIHHIVIRTYPRISWEPSYDQMQACREISLDCRAPESFTCAVKILGRLKNLEYAHLRMKPRKRYLGDRVVAALGRELHFMRQACRQLPASLKHFYLEIEWPGRHRTDEQVQALTSMMHSLHQCISDRRSESLGNAHPRDSCHGALAREMCMSCGSDNEGT